MNTTQSKFNFKALLTLLMILTLSVTLAFATSCKDGAESSSESESETTSESESESDSQTINNGNFEFYTSSTSSYPVSSSSTKWTKRTDSSTVSAPSSSVSSGIIDVADKAYESLSSTNKPKDSEDKAINPGTHEGAEGTKILMIHNSVTDKPGQGTAQYYTSSTTVTLAPTDCAKLTLWVRTDGLTSVQAGAYGAYIKIANTVNTTIEPLVIKNIDTKGVWVQYTVYLCPSDTAVTKYTVTLGLGMGNKYDTKELCEGFAYFDDVAYETISPEDFAAATASEASGDVKLYTADNKSVLDEESTAYAPSLFTVNEKDVVYVSGTERVFKLDFTKNLSSAADKIAGETGTWNKVNPNNTEEGHVGEVAQYDDAGYTDAEITVQNGGSVVVPANSVYMSFDGSKGGSSFSYVSKEFSLDGTAGEHYMKFSFLVKVKGNASATNASVAILDNGEDSSTGKFDSFTTNDLVSEYHDDYIRYTFYIANNYDETITFRIRFSFGPTVMATDKKMLPVGYAIFTDFRTALLTKDEYTAADTSTDVYAVKTTLYGSHTGDKTEEDEETEENIYEELNETYSFSVPSTQYPYIAQGKPVPSNSFTAKSAEADATMGVVNSAYAAQYSAYAGVSDALTSLENKLLADENKHVQPYMIYHTADVSSGLIGSKTVVPANSVYTFTAKVYVSGSAKAYIYLVATDDLVEEGDNAIYATAQYDKVEGKKYEMLATVDSATMSAVANRLGYVPVTFTVATGEESMSFRIEVWNGSRDGSEGSTGFVLVDSIGNGTSAAVTDIDGWKETYGSDGWTTESYQQKKIYSYYEEKDEENLVKDEDGNPVVTVGEVYEIVAISPKGNVQLYRYDVIDVYNIEERPADDSSTESTESVAASTSTDNTTIGNIAWLQIVSIIIAAVILLVLIAILVRMLWTKHAKKKAKTESYYGGYNKDKRFVPTKKSDGIEAPEKPNKAFDYDNLENNLDEGNEAEDETKE